MEEPQARLIQIREHESLGEEMSRMLRDSGFVPSDRGYMGIPSYLGICYGNSQEFYASYYVGACNLPENFGQLVVLPKIENLDFLSMLAVCSSYMPSADYFSLCYGINLNENPIENAECYDILTPLMALHYTFLLEKLIGRGLAKDYVMKQENLNNKVKGRIDVFQDWKQNIATSRRERVFCRYQEYTADIALNQLLKKAFKISQSCLHTIFRLPANHSMKYRNAVKYIADNMNDVSDVSYVPRMIPNRKNKLNPYYLEAINLAKAIIRHQETNITQKKNQHKFVHPFWIDFSRLFEVYVLALLREEYGNMIAFQVNGNKAVADYVHRSEHIIIDAKYKNIYQSEDYNINDIREISGNARDAKICSIFNNWSGDEPDCMIIYPDPIGLNNFNGPLLSSPNKKAISQFRKFYKIGISLPTLK